MFKPKNLLFLALLSAVVVSGAEYQLKLTPGKKVEAKTYTECAQGVGQVAQIDGRTALVLPDNNANTLVLKTPEFLKESVQGSISFSYCPEFPAVPKDTYLLLHTLLYFTQEGKGSAFVGINSYRSGEKIPYFLLCSADKKLNNYGPYKEFVLKSKTWYKFEITWDGKTISLYINGKLSDAKAQKGAIAFADTFSVGARVKGWHYSAPGWLADLTISDQPLQVAAK